VLLCLLRGYLNALSIPQVTLAVSLLIAILTAVSSVIAVQLVYTHSWSGDYLTFDVSNPEHLWILVRNTTVAALITLVWMRYLFLRQQVMLGLVAEGEARFRSLQARIQPHFLFNTLNTIASLIDLNPKAAESTLEHLATLLRSSLKATTDNVPLQQEIELCQHYLAIEQQRLGDKLQVDWHIEGDPNQLTLPALTLQPLVENAVYHGIQRLPKGGIIQIRLRAHTQGIHCQVINPLPATAAQPGNQTAHSNIQQRLAIRYGDSAKMTIQQTSEQYQVDLFLPNEVTE
jgi:two-component system sensor histidine kinase AlgZ